MLGTDDRPVLHTKQARGNRLDVSRVVSFIKDCQLDGGPRYAMYPGGGESLYGSCFALMTLHYVGEAQSIPVGERSGWAEYIQSFQSKLSGWFVGPEAQEEYIGDPNKFSLSHILMHLTVHAIPALAILGARPRLRFVEARRFVDKDYLNSWLELRDWRDAWLEGNNLLFVLQLLCYLRDVEDSPAAGKAAQDCFDWLDARIDPKTGLWGTNGHCSSFVAACGAYHQLLAYYHERRPLHHNMRLVDTVLALQHRDGGFSPRGGGGACEDVDAIDILVNCYKLHDYRRRDIRAALRMAVPPLLAMQCGDGGFLYRWNEPFDIMTISATSAPANVSNLFATWFRVHTLALISEIADVGVLRIWNFNPVLSMGWHVKSDRRPQTVNQRARDRLRACSRRARLRLQWARARAVEYLGANCPMALGTLRWMKRRCTRAKAGAP